MVSIAIQGICGRMGQTLINLIKERNDCNIVAGIDLAKTNCNDIPVYASLDAMKADGVQADVVIDFSNPVASEKLLAFSETNNLPCVICTTGLSEEVKSKLLQASENTAVFFSANMSLGINLLVQLVKKAQASLPGFDIEIIEKHHHNKLDAPSGTALMLADAINEQAGNTYQYVYDRQPLRQKRASNEIGLHAVRGGSIVGEHDVLFAGPDEVITLSHNAYSRDVFANGAIAAALYIAGKKPGFYNMQSMLETL